MADSSADRSLGKSVRLHGRSNFLSVLRERGSQVRKGKRCRIDFIDSPDHITCYGIKISKKVGRAVRRNRLKRAIREFLRNNKSLWPERKMIVISLDSPVDDERNLLAEIETLLKSLNE